jgi:hypothetical protein
MSSDRLNFDYETLHGRRVCAIKASGLQLLKDGSTACQKIAFIFDPCTLVISCEEDTDEIVFDVVTDSALTGPFAWTDFDILQEYVGQELGWAWFGTNYRGYADTFVLSFCGLEPQIALYVVGSSIWLYNMHKL